MYSEADRLRAIELYFKYGKKIVAVVCELGYPTERHLRRWIEAWKAGDGTINSVKRKPRYSTAQKQAAVDHYLTHGHSLAFTCRELGYPCTAILNCWLDELLPGKRRIITSTYNPEAPFTAEVKRKAVSDLCTRNKPAREIAQHVGVSRQLLYKWKDELVGDEACRSMRKRKITSETEDIDTLRNERDRLRQEIQQLQMEHDILKKADEIIKKDPGISAGPLTKREKTKVADALRETHPLPALLSTLDLARSSYFYHRAARQTGDKHDVVRVTLAELFHANYQCYGYRRLQAVLRNEGIRLSEKVIRRLMSEEKLVVSTAHRRRYSSYCGEIGPAPDNLLARDFTAGLPNQKWLTDITEFHLPAGKVWLSPVVDCFDGKVVSWSLGTRPDAMLTNKHAKTTRTPDHTQRSRRALPVAGVVAENNILGSGALHVA